MSAVRLLDDARNEADYRSLFLQASERGRLDAWEVAAVATQKAKLTSGKMQKPPIAYFRTVLRRSWDTDKEHLQVKSGAAALAPSPAPMSPACVDRVEECPDDLGEGDFDDEVFQEWQDDLGDEADNYSHPHADDGKRRGSDALFAVEATGRREYSAPRPRQSYEAAKPAPDFTSLLNALPAALCENLLSRAEDEVRQGNTAFWAKAKNSKAGVRLIQQKVREIVDREGQTAR